MFSFGNRARRGAAALAVFALASAAGATPAAAQDQRLVEEVVVRVNADVITRSQYLEALRDTESDFKQNFPGDEGAKRFAEFRPKVLDLLVDNMLIVQKGQELGIDVDTQVNEQFIRLAKDQNMTITQFEEAMRANGVEPNEARSRLREKFVRDAVINQEVYGTIWRGLSERQKREFYDANKEKFMVPGEIKLSEVYLPVEGRSFSEIEATGREIAKQARAGTPFADLVKKHGDPTRASFANGGSLGSFKSAADLAENLVKVVEPLKTGDVTEPIRVGEGVIIIRMDERREAAPRKFEEVERDVSLAIVYERSRAEEQKFLKKLRSEAYIRVSEGYALSGAGAEPPAPAAASGATSATTEPKQESKQ